MKKVYIETLGCPRNQVDSEITGGLIWNSNYEITENPEEARFIIVNTCGFIEDAINESVETILSLSQFKTSGKCEFLIVGGCLAQRFKEELAEELPEADFFVGTGAYFKIPEILNQLENKKVQSKSLFPKPDSGSLQKFDTPKILSTYPYSFLKVAEGCARRCTYCIIPDLRGPLRSRDPLDIIKEAEKIIESGAKEIVLISQETTDYGRDLKGEADLSFILDKVSLISKDVWIRFMYGHPLSISDKLLEVISGRDNICPYFDIPLQHASNDVLKKMGRGYNLSFARKLFSSIRNKVENAALRTTLITGFPGETEDDFKILSDFMEEIRFDHAGVFIYSEMEDLFSSRFENKVDFETAEKRQMILMEKQALISQEKNSRYLEKKLPVIIDNKDSGEFFAGRTMFQAPEVDGITYVDGKNLKPGDIVNVFITDAFDYDLAGNVE